MANARVTRTLAANSAFKRDINQVVAAETARRFAEVGRLAEQEFDRIVTAEFVNDRPPDRRRTGRHLLGSSNARVLWDGVGFPVTISLGSTAEGKKLGALNYGSPPHAITGNLVFPVAERIAGGIGPKALKPKASRIRAAYGKGNATYYVRTQEVRHPGNKPHHMLERALESAVRKTYRRSVVIARIRH